METNPARLPSSPDPRPGTLALDGELPSARTALAVLRDVVDMAKGRITLFVVFTAAMGWWLAPGSAGAARAGLFLVATAVLVGSANMLNCWIEREVDGRMHRTRNRPLPAGRLDPWSALALAISLAAFALPALLLLANHLTALLGFTALATYVLAYTPLKRVSPRALEVGAIPGAIPPLMGWAAAGDGLGATAWALFGILYCWQLPHFIAIALCLEPDYARGGMQVLPVSRGPAVARRYMFGYTLVLVAVSLVPAFLGLAGPAYAATAAVLGAGFTACAAGALRERGGTLWARRVFLYSLLYLPVLFSVFVLDAG